MKFESYDIQSDSHEVRNLASKPKYSDELKHMIRGWQKWLNYFRMASITGKLKDLDSWIRNRLRYCIWTDWKKPERKRKNVVRLGVF
jgi:hypothetical protein